MCHAESGRHYLADSAPREGVAPAPAARTPAGGPHVERRHDRSPRSARRALARRRVGAAAATFTIDAGPVGHQVHLTPDLVEISPGVFTSTAETIVEGSFRLSWDLHLEGDPALIGSFTLVNLMSVPQDFSITATLGLLPLPAPTRAASSRCRRGARRSRARRVRASPSTWASPSSSA
jgi:hypothetical protein